MENPFGSIHYNNIGTWLRQRFGCQVSKLSLDGGFTCPNRDGSKGYAGCSFCSWEGSGEFASAVTPETIADAMQEQIALLSRKWPEGKYIAYFQSHTNTYAPLEKLRALFDAALAVPGVAGLAIATRPDCLPPDVLELLSEYNRRTFLWVELGLQTMHDHTADMLNRCYPTSVFAEAAAALRSREIPFLVHLIFGLPGETKEDMLASVRFAAAQKPFGIKIHSLSYLSDSTLGRVLVSQEKGYNCSYKAFPPLRPLELQEYIDLVVDALEILPPEITVHRITGDAPADTLIAPLWPKNKHAVLNGIQQEFKKRGSFQGCRAE